MQNVACVCENWQEFCIELEEWGVTSAAKIEFDDPELDTQELEYKQSTPFALYQALLLIFTIILLLLVMMMLKLMMID